MSYAATSRAADTPSNEGLARDPMPEANSHVGQGAGVPVARHDSDTTHRPRKLPPTGYLRLRDIIGKAPSELSPGIPPIIPVSRSTWWAGVRSGRFPRPTRALGPGIAAWRVESILALIEQSSFEEEA